MERLGPLKLHERIDEYSREVFSLPCYSKISLENELKAIKKIRPQYIYAELLSHSQNAVQRNKALRVELGLGNLYSELILYRNTVYGIKTKGEDPAYGSQAASLIKRRIYGDIDLAVYEFDVRLLPFKVEVTPTKTVSRDVSELENTLVKIYDIVYRTALRHVVKVLDVEAQPSGDRFIVKVNVKRGGGFFWGRTKSRFIRSIEDTAESKLGLKIKVELIEIG